MDRKITSAYRNLPDDLKESPSSVWDQDRLGAIADWSDLELGGREPDALAPVPELLAFDRSRSHELLEGARQRLQMLALVDPRAPESTSPSASSSPPGTPRSVVRPLQASTSTSPSATPERSGVARPRASTGGTPLLRRLSSSLLDALSPRRDSDAQAPREGDFKTQTGTPPGPAAGSLSPEVHVYHRSERLAEPSRFRNPVLAVGFSMALRDLLCHGLGALCALALRSGIIHGLRQFDDEQDGMGTPGLALVCTVGALATGILALAGTVLARTHDAHRADAPAPAASTALAMVPAMLLATTGLSTSLALGGMVTGKILARTVGRDLQHAVRDLLAVEWNRFFRLDDDTRSPGHKLVPARADGKLVPAGSDLFRDYETRRAAIATAFYLAMGAVTIFLASPLLAGRLGSGCVSPCRPGYKDEFLDGLGGALASAGLEGLDGLSGAIASWLAARSLALSLVTDEPELLPPRLDRTTAENISSRILVCAPLDLVSVLAACDRPAGTRIAGLTPVQLAARLLDTALTAATETRSYLLFRLRNPQAWRPRPARVARPAHPLLALSVWPRARHLPYRWAPGEQQPPHGTPATALDAASEVSRMLHEADFRVHAVDAHAGIAHCSSSVDLRANRDHLPTLAPHLNESKAGAGGRLDWRIPAALLCPLENPRPARPLPGRAVRLPARVDLLPGLGGDAVDVAIRRRLPLSLRRGDPFTDEACLRAGLYLVEWGGAGSEALALCRSARRVEATGDLKRQTLASLGEPTQGADGWQYRVLRTDLAIHPRLTAARGSAAAPAAVMANGPITLLGLSDLTQRGLALQRAAVMVLSSPAAEQAQGDAAHGLAVDLRITGVDAANGAFFCHCLPLPAGSLLRRFEGPVPQTPCAALPGHSQRLSIPAGLLCLRPD